MPLAAETTTSSEAAYAFDAGNCLHCSLPVPDSPNAFCCHGCEAVYALLHDNNLQDYYHLRDATSTERQAVSATSQAFDELDDPHFQEQNLRKLGDLRATQFYVEGAHCAACVWLLEKLPSLCHGVQSCRLDLSRSLVTVTWDPQQVALSRIAQGLNSLGYTPHLHVESKHEDLQRVAERRLLIRLGVAGAVAGNVMLFSFALYSGEHHGMAPEFLRLFRWLSLLVTVPAVAWTGQGFFRGAWAALKTRTPHMDLPISLGIGVGLLSGALNTLRDSGPVYFDSVTALLFILLVGRWVEQKQRTRAQDARQLLLSLVPSSARLWASDSTRQVPASSVPTGAIIEVRPGEPFPIDGKIVHGSSTLDASLLTGESRPGEIRVGDPVYTGCVNQSAVVRVACTASGVETRVGRLMQGIQDAAQERTPIVQLADRISGFFVLSVLGVALLTGLYWSQSSGHMALEAAIAVLIVSCPCALGLATPLAISSGIAQAARQRILIQGGHCIERLAHPALIVFDKTGTLTDAQLKLVSWDGNTTWQPMVRALEAHSNHPIAKTIRKTIPDANLPALANIREIFGRGLTARHGEQTLTIGSPSFVREQGNVAPPWAERALQEHGNLGRTVIAFATSGEIQAIIALEDTLRPEAPECLRRLQRSGHELAILSGDDPQVVEALAQRLAVPLLWAHGGIGPEEKRSKINALKASGRSVLMVGDGVNDAAALAASDVGIAVRGGAEDSLKAADVFLGHSGLRPLIELLEGARSCQGVVRRGILFSLAYNAVFVSLAVTGNITPLMAAILMPLSSLTVLTHAYRVRIFPATSSLP